MMIFYFILFQSRDSMFQLNPEQQSAVENIVYAKNYPLPYILIGPPGKAFLIFSLITREKTIDNIFL